MSNKVRVEVFYTNHGSSFRAVEEVSPQGTLEETYLAAWREVFRKEKAAKVNMLYLYANPIGFNPKELFSQ
jgi:hypothetical protein